MAKIHLKRLQRKYNFKEGEVTGVNYRTLIKDILVKEKINASKAVARLSESNYEKQSKKITDKEKRLILPDISEVIPGRSIFVKKAAQDGNIITDTLRDRLTGALRESLTEFKTKFRDDPAFIRRAGPDAGTINPKAVNFFEKKIRKVYENYTKIDPKIGIPKNIRQITITEMRFAINPIKQAYNMQLLKKNPGAKMFKTWRQNKMLSKVPRRGHSIVNGKKIPITDYFMVPLYKKGKIVSYSKMMHPHDLTAEAEQNIGCNCDTIYSIVKE
jgi:hypothetical protein